MITYQSIKCGGGGLGINLKQINAKNSDVKIDFFEDFQITLF